MSLKRWYRIGLIGSLVCLTLVTYGLSAVAQGTAKNIVVYFPEWGIYGGHNNFFPEHVPFDKVTHINYAFLEIKKDGTDNFRLNIIDPWASLEISDDWGYPPERRGSINRLSYQRDNFYPHVKLLFSVGGWSRSGYFSEMANTQAGRATFIASCVSFVRQYRYDGIDLDWEYPGVSRGPSNSPPGDQGNPVVGDDFVNFTLLLKELRAALDTAGTQDGKRYQLTIAASVAYEKIDKTDPGAYHQYLDFINVMSYDIHGAWDEKTNHQSALYPNPNDPSGTAPTNIKERYNSDYGMRYYLSKGVPAEKLNMGIPYYGRGWKGVGTDGDNGLFASHGGAATTGAWDGFVAPYYQQRTWANGADGFSVHRDPHAQVPWLYSPSQQIMWTYEDVTSVQNKCDYVMQNNFGGVIIWDITGDYPNEPGRYGTKGAELGTAIFERLGGTPPPTPTPGPTVTPTQPPTPTPTPDPTNPCSGVSAWQSDTVYLAGDRVTHNNTLYSAKWWTKGEEPGVAGAWELISACDPTPNPTPTPDPANQCVGVSAWQSGSVYVAGDRVTHADTLYSAKWWTQGEEPGVAAVWEYISACSSPAQMSLPAAAPRSFEFSADEAFPEAVAFEDSVPSAVPEPGTLALFSLALTGLALYWRNIKRRS